MPRHYTAFQKGDALQLLDSLYGDIALTSDRTGIPERTLRDWRRERERSSPPSPPPFSAPPPPPNKPPEFEEDLDALVYIREQIMAELLNISANMHDTFAQTAPHKRLRVLTELLDRLMVIDAAVEPYEPTPWYRFSWETGLYVRTRTERHGPFTPDDIPKNWREIFGEEPLLEIYWGDNKITPIPEGPFMERVLHTYTVEDNNEVPRFNTFVDDYWDYPGWRDRTEDYTLDNGIRKPRNEFSQD
jgi:hypothetical protein